jgi:hypothetical protein
VGKAAPGGERSPYPGQFGHNQERWNPRGELERSGAGHDEQRHDEALDQRRRRLDHDHLGDGG